MKSLYLLIPLAPLLGAIVAGLAGRVIGRAGAHWVTILSVMLSFLASVWVFVDVYANGTTWNGSIYTWITSGETKLEIGFLIDRLSALMMVVVTFVSLMVHIYTIGYMAGDPGYQRFFSYISLFTFSMLMLVMANNFLQLFFGWEAVGLVSYLLIGFWYTRPTAIFANLKAFLVNRVGDFGFLLAIALILAQFGSLDYNAVFSQAPSMAAKTISIIPGSAWLLITVICIGLFIGAMGKSAQFPLHVWLPDSMEGPTPISALIHAATMVTAGIFMVARMSPLFELSQTALSVVILIGAITAMSMALVAITQFDIKRVVAYSTLSQLGYMTTALGASAYSVGMFHLATHAFFKAVLFLGAGSVIIAMHHEQDMRRMGGLRRWMPITYWTMVVGAWANAGLPPFSGFFSKDSILEAVHLAGTPVAGFAYWMLLIGVFAGGVYSFRLIFMTFHGEPRMDKHTLDQLHESPAVVTLPLVLLAIPAVLSGFFIGNVLVGDYFGSSIVVRPEHPAMAQMATDYHGVWSFIAHAVSTPPLWLATGGAALAAYLYLVRPDLPKRIAMRFGFAYAIVERKFGFDELYQWLFAAGARVIGRGLWRGGDVAVIDGLLVNGSARLVGWFSSVVRHFQTGLIYQYAFVMIIGVLVVVSAFVFLPLLMGKT